MSSPNDRADKAGPSRSADASPLPYEKAFVVQFSAETDAPLENAAGRVEHLQTGRQARFTSAVELLASLRALLADGPPPSSSPRGEGADADRDSTGPRGRGRTHRHPRRDTP